MENKKEKLCNMIILDYPIINIIQKLTEINEYMYINKQDKLFNEIIFKPYVVNNYSLEENKKEKIIYIYDNIVTKVLKVTREFY